ncbi:heavy metal translocating P-type ATPase [Megasphaera vaginalis (ex Bordigoni et al. 2020)]|uniref:heavy metal translocating P-type ATPase n=1 Tax=Megasphaera vaginalis (ex Bordigoni et al. 2020) TaxID=2045301 RepID=UPI000C7C7833|nr:heavy metal translocating P-type ATPase [Megasphaera vaginalis (ex Bordigoni et al. 2020)]
MCEKMSQQEPVSRCTCTCGCCGEQAEESGKKRLLPVFAGICAYLAAYIWPLPDKGSLYLYGFAYLLIGKDVIQAAWRNIRRKDPFDENLLMVIASGGAFLIGDCVEAVAVMLFSRIGEFLEERAAGKSRRQIKAAIDLRPDVVCRIRDGRDVETIPAAAARTGDRLLVRPGDRIPLDGIVAAGESVLDMSALTGEALPLTCREGDGVLSGAINKTGVIELTVTKELAQSTVSKILQAVAAAEAQKPRLDRFITRFCRLYTPAVVAAAIVTAVVPSLAGGQWHYWLYTALTFLVISCPCALVISIPLAFSAAIGAAAKGGILFKGAAALERLHEVKTVIFDKTGTLTEGRFSAQRVCAAGRFTEAAVLAAAGAVEQGSQHPLAKGIVAAATVGGRTLSPALRSREFAGEGVVAIVDGHSVACGSLRLLQRLGTAVPSVAAAGAAVIFVAVDGEYAGHIILTDTVKDDAAAAVNGIKKLGLYTAMVTGDRAAAAGVVAGTLGIDQTLADCLPQDKVAALSSLRQERGAVFFVGDGINDGPVLSGADVGGAMGSGADIAVDAADVIYMHGAVSAVLRSLLLSRQTLAVVRQNVVFALGVKGLVMLAGLAGFASMWGAVFADAGVAVLCIANSVRILYQT